MVTGTDGLVRYRQNWLEIANRNRRVCLKNFGEKYKFIYFNRLKGNPVVSVSVEHKLQESR